MKSLKSLPLPLLVYVCLLAIFLGLPQTHPLAVPPTTPTPRPPPLSLAKPISLPYHAGDASSDEINAILRNTEDAINEIRSSVVGRSKGYPFPSENDSVAPASYPALSADPLYPSKSTWSGRVYSNSYVDLGKVNVVGFDYDYTLISYTPALLSLIYDMALSILVEKRGYPEGLLTHGLAC